MVDAVVFDFDGVIVDSEPLHFHGFREVLLEEGITLSREAYYSDYLGYDDKDCFAKVLGALSQNADPDRVAALTQRKNRVMRTLLSESVQALPGAADLIRSLAERGTPLAICSGALRDEILLAAETVGLRDYFPVIVAAEDVRHGKPDPEGYLAAIDQLSKQTGRTLPAGRSAVIEDSPFGISAGKAAGMRVLGVATSYPAEELTEADRVVELLTQADANLLDALVAGGTA